MQKSIQTSLHYSDLLGDTELAHLLDSGNEQQALIAVEVALAKAQESVGLVPTGTGDAMENALADISLDATQMAAGISGSGVPVPALLAQLRKQLPAQTAQWLHWGATSQDIVDTASVLQIGQCIELLQARLSALLDALQQQAQQHTNTVMAGRTRTQLATPITLALRIAQWAQPLIELEQELSALRKKVLRIQFGGAVGANTAVAPHGPEITQHMAQQLGLEDTAPWHTDRSATTALAHWLLQLSNALAKFGKDLMILSRSEIAELRAGTAGGSSTMPQKANPVQSEMLVSMNTVAQALHSGLLAAASPVEERDGASWTVEWILLPQLLLTVGCALKHGLSLAQTLSADTTRMAQTVKDNPQLMAEAASFALAAHMPRSEALALVKKAALSSKPLDQALAELSDAKIDWKTALDPCAVIEPCKHISEAIFYRRAR